MLIGAEGRWWNRKLPIKPIGHRVSTARNSRHPRLTQMSYGQAHTPSPTLLANGDIGRDSGTEPQHAL
jgi:hypothetical protein